MHALYLYFQQIEGSAKPLQSFKRSRDATHFTTADAIIFSALARMNIKAKSFKQRPPKNKISKGRRK